MLNMEIHNGFVIILHEIDPLDGKATYHHHHTNYQVYPARNSNQGLKQQMNGTLIKSDKEFAANRPLEARKAYRLSKPPLF